MQVATRISRERLAVKVGRRLRVLVDEVAKSTAVARSAADAPEIDGVVRISRASRLKPGDWAEVEVVGAGDYDLEARLL